MAKSNDKRLAVAYQMPQGLRKKQPGQEYQPENDEVLKWVAEQPELLVFLVSKLAAWRYIRFDPESGTWGGMKNAD